MRQRVQEQVSRLGRRQKLDLWLAVFFILLFATLSVAAHFRVRTTLVDDAYITYRYAANFATGNGLVYNPGERILGTSTPAYALLLGTIAKIVGLEAVPSISKALNVVFLLFAGCAAGVVGKRLTGRCVVGAAVFGMATVGPMALQSSMAGMETPLFLALLSLGILALVMHRPYIAAVATGFAPLVRPEGLFVVGVVGIALIISQLRKPPGELSLQGRLLPVALLLVPGFAWFLIALSYYGSPIPHPVSARQAGLYPVGIAGSLGPVLDRLTGDSLLIGFRSGRSHVASVNLYVFLLATSIVLFFLGIGGVWLWKKDSSLATLPVLLALFLLCYSISGTLLFRRYYANFEILARLCWWSGLFAVGSALIEHSIGQARQARLTILLGTGTALLVLLPCLVRYPWTSIWLGQVDTREIDRAVLRQAAYRALALELAPRLPANTVILMPEIGELGYYLPEVRVLDACGLVSPEAIPYLPVPQSQRASPELGVIPPDMVRDYRPDLIITLEVFGRRGILDAPWFWSDYSPVIVWQGDWLPWDSTALYVFSRNDFEPGLALRDLATAGL